MHSRLYLLFFVLSGWFPAVTQATALKNCFSTPVNYNATYNHELNAADNHTGTTLLENYLSGNGIDQEANCKCTGGVGTTTPVYEYTGAASPLSPGSNGRGFLTDRLDLIVSGYTDAILSNTNLTLIPVTTYPTPLDKMESRLDLKNTEKTASVCSDDTRPPGGTTVKRQFRWNTVSLKFVLTRPIFGSEVIPPTVVVQYYACLYYGSACTFADMQHVSDVTLNGLITAPLSCTINSGSTIEIDMGDVTTPQFIHKGQIPAGYRLRDVDIAYHCDDPEAMGTSDKITLKLSADQGVTEGSSSLIAKMIGRDDIGVRMFDENSNNVVLDGSVAFPVTLDQDGNGHIKMTAAPVGTKDAPPAAGVYEGNVTVKMEIK